MILVLCFKNVTKLGKVKEVEDSATVITQDPPADPSLDPLTPIKSALMETQADFKGKSWR